MNTKHTPGEWKATSTGNIYGLVNGEWIVVAVASDMPCDDFAAERGMDMERANARLIAAAPDGLEVAEAVYAAMLNHPHDLWRVKNQHEYCALRDFIAKATGRTAEEVQNEFEERAAIAKAKGGA